MKLTPEYYALLEALSEEFRNEYDLDVKAGLLEIHETPVEEVYAFTFYPDPKKTPNLKDIELKGAVVTGEMMPGEWGAQVMFHPLAEAARKEG